jgi:hypothetical protein
LEQKHSSPNKREKESILKLLQTKMEAGQTEYKRIRATVERETIHGVAIKKPDCFYDSFPATSMTKRRVGH